MSWQTPRERDFRLTGTFMMKRNGSAGDLEFKHGDTVTYEQLSSAGVSDRIIQRMYGGHWMDMAQGAPEPGPASASGQALVHDSGHSQDAPGGPENGSEGDEEQAGEGASGSAPSATEGGAASVEGQETAPTDLVAVAYKCFGFGKFWPINAAGEKLADKPISKVQAEGLANSAQVPLLGQTGALLGATAE